MFHCVQCIFLRDVARHNFMYGSICFCNSAQNFSRSACTAILSHVSIRQIAIRDLL